MPRMSSRASSCHRKSSSPEKQTRRLKKSRISRLVSNRTRVQLFARRVKSPKHCRFIKQDASTVLVSHLNPADLYLSVELTCGITLVDLTC